MNELHFELFGIELRVTYDYSEGEKRTHDYSGTTESVRINGIYVSECEWNVISEVSATEMLSIEEETLKLHR